MSAVQLLHFESVVPNASDDASQKTVIEQQLGTIKGLPPHARAAVYQEISWYYNPTLEHPYNYLVLSQSGREDDEVGGNDEIESSITDGEHDARRYRLIQDFNPKHDDGLGSQILTIEITPSDAEDMHRWHEQEHLPLIATYQGFNRSWRYQLDSAAELARGVGEKPADFLVVHEVDDVATTFSQEKQMSAMTPWAIKVLQNSSKIRTKAWKLIGRGKEH